MTLDLDRLMRLWDVPPDGDGHFGAMYADPFLLNGRPVAAAALTGVAAGLHAALADQRREILDVVDAGGGRIAVAFVLHGRHVGPLPTRIGTVPPTGRTVEATVIDLFTVVDGLITEVRAVSDELGMLAGLDAVTLRTDGGPAPR
jgi:predicted ester cyclase